MQLISHSFQNGKAIPGEFAFAVPDTVARITLSTNRNPHLSWSDVPVGTESFAIVCYDPDVPSRGDDVNQVGREVSVDLPRIDFYHWLLLDIPPHIRQIDAGSHSCGVTPRGKSGPNTFNGLRHGLNDYTNWFAGDAQMSGDYYGYDGPCPPWNDAVIHRYIFTVYALAIPRLQFDGLVTGANVRAALATSPVLGHASLIGLYGLNPAVQVG